METTAFAGPNLYTYTPDLEELEARKQTAERALTALLVKPDPESVSVQEETENLSLAERRLLTEVTALVKYMRPDGGVPDDIVRDTKANLVSQVKEMAIPRAVHTSYQPYRNGAFIWRRQTDLDVARSGYDYYEPAIHPRVDQDVAEALHVRRALRVGRYLSFLSVRMTDDDAPKEVAERAHLHRDDLLRIHWPDIGPDGNIKGKYMQSALVRDVPPSAWVAMLKDPGNIFGKSIQVEDETSSLAILKIFDQLDVPQDRLPNGVVSLVEAVLPYVPAENRQSVAAQIELFLTDQDEIQRKAENVADRWLAFDYELAKSIKRGRATPEVVQFVNGLADHWNDDDLALLEAHRVSDDSLSMSYGLAARLEEAKQNLLLVPAAVVSGNEEIIQKLGPQRAREIYIQETRIQEMQQTGRSAQDIAAVERNKDRHVAEANVSVGGGCPGEVSGNFRKTAANKTASKKQDKDPKKDGNDKKVKDKKEKRPARRKREWMMCVRCPLCKKDDVKAYIDYLPDKGKKRITCCSCHGHKEYDYK